MERREFLKTIGYASACFFTPGLVNVTMAEKNYLNEPLGTSSLLNPQKFKSLTEEQINVLLHYGKFIVQKWKLPVSSMDNIENVIRKKVKPQGEFVDGQYENIVFPPSSYYTEYLQAIDALHRLSREHGVDDALTEIFRMDAEISESFWQTRRGHIREWVIKEFSYVLVRDGGFKKYKFRNYRGVFKRPIEGDQPNSATWPYRVYVGDRNESPTDDIYEMTLLEGKA